MKNRRVFVDAEKKKESLILHSADDYLLLFIIRIGYARGGVGTRTMTTHSLRQKTYYRLVGV